MLSKRIIACLDIADGKVVKGMRFRNHAILGDPLELAIRAQEQGADEIVIYDITASPEKRGPDLKTLSEIAKVLNVPLCMAGGITTVDIAHEVLSAGADKVSVNSPALRRPQLIDELAKRFGSQCVVIGMDSFADENGHFVWLDSGKPNQTQRVGISTIDWLREVQSRGAGEVVLNSISFDGLRQGYDIALLKELRKLCKVPLVASGGAGKLEHFIEVFGECDVDAALLAGSLHRGEIDIRDLKTDLALAKIPVRLLRQENQHANF